jgi:hypothetical protein
MYPPLSKNSLLTTTEQSGRTLGRAGQGLLVLWSVCLLAGFAIAFVLEPDPRGYGTHQKLGLPACTFRTMFGVPCPSCGMTTSFAHFSRGQFQKAIEVNLAGFLLAVVCAVQIPWCWLSALSGRLWKISRPELCLVWCLALVAGVSFVQWLWRVSMT